MKLLLLSLFLIVACMKQTVSNKKVIYRAEAGGRTLDCKNIVASNYGTYILSDCTCWHSGKKFDVIRGVTGILEYTE